MAKGLTGGVIPMGGVAMRNGIFDSFMTGSEDAIEFAHGYTYSGHPVAASAGLATLAVYAEEGLFDRAKVLESVMEEAVHSLKGLPHVIDIRNIGLIGAVELEPIPGMNTKRGMMAFRQCFDADVLVRSTGDTIAVAPPLIVSETEIEKIFDTLRKVLIALD